ncbi:hypothetical protein [Halopseudomonas salina]|uniref:Uncharacterized protein n=1 Tax=Halopseudomonas salina TaxID=1323744 RepID=A0ABQ1PKP5_9GAMM|nr:hypothetical protein [Halopseudomonas salina]GGC98812.1 hypothetical protein GCM10007418_17650 [Halopseudomonas salina]
MPDRLQLTTLQGREFQQDQHNLIHMLRHLAALDELCRSLGVSRISGFVDISLLELEDAANLMARETPGEIEADSETGMVLAIEDLVWHSAALGMASLEAAIHHLERGTSSAVDQIDVPGLLADLRLCQKRLEPLEAQGGQFHLSVRNE